MGIGVGGEFLFLDHCCYIFMYWRTIFPSSVEPNPEDVKWESQRARGPMKWEPSEDRKQLEKFGAYVASMLPKYVYHVAPPRHLPAIPTTPVLGFRLSRSSFCSHEWHLTDAALLCKRLRHAMLFKARISEPRFAACHAFSSADLPLTVC